MEVDIWTLDSAAPDAERVLRQAWLLLVCDPEWPKDEVRSINEAMDRHRFPARYGCEELVVIASSGGQRNHVQGLAVVQCMAEVETALLEYLAVARASRYAGIGSELYRHARNDAKMRGIRHLLVEYDSPGDVNEEGRQRWRWYDRLGVHRLTLDYFQPPYHSGDGWKPMALAYDAALNGPPHGWMEISRGIREIYRRVYAADLTTPFAGTLLDSLAHPPPLQLLKADGVIVWQTANDRIPQGGDHEDKSI